MSTLTSTLAPKQKQSIFSWISNHWFETFLILYGLWVFIPWLAPLFMKLGWTVAGNTVYFIYSFFCHQLPERSLFFFGEKRMYSLAEIQSVWQNTANPMVLRKFIGNETMGWKIAWSPFTRVCGSLQLCGGHSAKGSGHSRGGDLFFSYSPSRWMVVHMPSAISLALD